MRICIEVEGCKCKPPVAWWAGVHHWDQWRDPPLYAQTARKEIDTLKNPLLSFCHAPFSSNMPRPQNPSDVSLNSQVPEKSSSISWKSSSGSSLARPAASWSAPARTPAPERPLRSPQLQAIRAPPPKLRSLSALAVYSCSFSCKLRSAELDCKTNRQFLAFLF